MLYCHVCLSWLDCSYQTNSAQVQAKEEEIARLRLALETHQHDSLVPDRTQYTEEDAAHTDNNSVRVDEQGTHGPLCPQVLLKYQAEIAALTEGVCAHYRQFLIDVIRNRHITLEEARLVAAATQC